MPIAHVRGEELYWEQQGSGPPLVMIRGLSRSLRFWEPFLPHLRDHFTLLLFDHRGIGRSKVNDVKFNMRDLAHDLAAVMDSAGVARANVFGISLGGMVAQHLALDFPDKIERLVLASTTAGGVQSRFPRVDTLLWLAATNRLPVPLATKLQAPRIVSPKTATERPEIAASWIPFLEMEPINSRVVIQQALSGAFHDVADRIPALVPETLVITGNRDRLINHTNSERLARWIPKSKLVVLDGFGHDIVAEGPERVAAEVKEFLLQR
jgi:pimeloyl-ACP methyl ester carboxylesterase